MLRTLNELTGYKIKAKDDSIGKVSDFLFDDELWSIRYLVVDTGRWIPGRLVILSPVSIDRVDWENAAVHLDLTKDRIEKSPGIEKDQPVHRQKEEVLAEYYQWPLYWKSGHGSPEIPVTAIAADRARREDGGGDSNLRSVEQVTGYHIRATDGEIGHVEGWVAEDVVWSIRYMIVDTKNWLPGRKVLIAPRWIENVAWSRKEVDVNLTRESIEKSPEFNPNEPVNRQYEARLYDYYGRPRYWEKQEQR